MVGSANAACERVGLEWASVGSQSSGRSAAPPPASTRRRFATAPVMDAAGAGAAAKDGRGYERPRRVLCVAVKTNERDVKGAFEEVWVCALY